MVPWSLPTGGEIGGRSPDAISIGPPELVATVVVGAVLRLYRLADESLWLDEAYSVGIVRRRSFGWLAFQHPTYDPHPPLHYLLLKPWVAFVGPSEMAVRLYAVLFGLLTIAVAYALGRELFDRRVGAIGALLVAVAPFHVWHSQNVRMYGLLAFLTGVSTLALVRLARESTRRRAMGYVVATALMTYTHVFGLFVVLAQSAYLLTRPLLPGRELSLDVRQWLPLQAVVALLLSPWLLELAARTVRTAAGPSSHLSWIPEPNPSFFLEAFYLFVSGKHLDWHLDPAIPAGAPIVASSVAGALLVLATTRFEERWSAGDDEVDDVDDTIEDRTDDVDDTIEDEAGTEAGTEAHDADDRRYSHDRRQPDARRNAQATADSHDLAGVWLLVLLAVVPVAAPYVLSTVVSPILVLRYTIPATLGVYLLIARGAGTIRSPGVRYLLVGVLVLGMLAPLPAYYGQDQKAQWEAAATDVEAGTDGDDLVVLAPAHVWWPFDYYFDGGAEIRTADASTTAAELQAMARGYDRVYLVFRYPGEETRNRLRTALREGGGGRTPTERSYVVVTVVRYENSSAG
jgi:hypothetical protein